jgi:threonine/homoserine/homoserine lactone efflux protein
LSTRRVERAFARFRRVLDAIMGAMLVALGARLAIER